MMPEGHAARVRRMLVSLEGLSVGDAFGEQFFGAPGVAQTLIAQRRVPPPRWRYTDDTAMALSIVDVLCALGTIDQDRLAGAFAARYDEDPGRGYGSGAHKILSEIGAGVRWSEASTSVFHGQGSLGNGSAMRVAPLGAYFASDIDRLIEEAARSAQVTHAHPEGQAGAVATALAAAYASTAQAGHDGQDAGGLLEFVATRTPAGAVLDGIRQAMALPAHTTQPEAARILGSGDRVSCADTVPYCLWTAARHLASYEDALWATVAGLGDRDTTCAIVGGIVALSAGRASIPERWLVSRESLGLLYAPDRATTDTPRVEP